MCLYQNYFEFPRPSLAVLGVPTHQTGLELLLGTRKNYYVQEWIKSQILKIGLYNSPPILS